jgi:hypothetical protein
LAIVVGAVTSALVIGLTMLALNAAGTHYTNQGLPDVQFKIPEDAAREKVGRPHEDDKTEYRVVFARRDEYPNTPPGRYLVDESGHPKYKTDIPIQRESKVMDNGKDAPKGFDAPQPALFTSIIEGILGGKLEWGLVLIGVLIAISLELAGVPALPFAVGMYIPFSSTSPIFIGGLLRWVTDRLRGKSASDTETETSPGVLLSSGYIAGGTLCGLVLAFFAFFGEDFNEKLAIGKRFATDYLESDPAKILSLVTFAILCGILFWVGSRKSQPTEAAQS